MYALAGIPVLLSTLRALLIEANRGMYGLGENRGSLKRLASEPNEIKLISENYLQWPKNLELSLLYEVRNEIVHPAHTPSGAKHNTPDPMLLLRELNLLQSTSSETSDYVWISQLQSHRLFRWAFQFSELVAGKVIERHHSSKGDGLSHLDSYQTYKKYDL